MSATNGLRVILQRLPNQWRLWDKQRSRIGHILRRSANQLFILRKCILFIRHAAKWQKNLWQHKNFCWQSGRTSVLKELNWLGQHYFKALSIETIWKWTGSWTSKIRSCSEYFHEESFPILLEVIKNSNLKHLLTKLDSRWLGLDICRIAKMSWSSNNLKSTLLYINTNQSLILWVVHFSKNRII